MSQGLAIKGSHDIYKCVFYLEGLQHLNISTSQFIKKLLGERLQGEAAVILLLAFTALY